MTESTDEPRVWEMHAAIIGRGADRERLDGFGHERFAAAHASNRMDVIPVRLIEDPDGELLGWIDSESERERAAEIMKRPVEAPTPKMVTHHRLFHMNFPYGPAVEVEHGKGDIVRLRSERIETA